MFSCMKFSVNKLKLGFDLAFSHSPALARRWILNVSYALVKAAEFVLKLVG